MNNLSISVLDPAARTMDLILESLPVMAWLTDESHRVTWVRGSASRFLGLDRDVRSIVGEGHPLAAAHQSALAGASRAIDMDWLDRSYEMRIQPLRDAGGSIVGCIGSGHDVTELRRAERLMKYQASFDPLTGAYSRSYFLERLHRSLLQSRRAGVQWTLAVARIDQLDAVNESYGTAAGDDIVRAVANRLAATLPNEVLFGRIETDEFALLLPPEYAGEAVALTESWLTECHEPFLIGEHEIRVSLSIGTAMFPFDGGTADHLLRSAKTAARCAQQLGGGRTQVFFSALTTDFIQQFELDRDMWRAIDREEFFLVYQPQVSLADGSVEGVEALLRWRKNGEVLPARSFIPRLEESSLIVPVGRWVIERALQQFRMWREQGIHVPRIAVNVGARQLADDSFVSMIASALERHRIAPHQLDLEITETAAMLNVDTSLRTLEALCQLGVDVTIDDFGAGYSSLNYLRRMAVTGLKIDRSFVADLPGSMTDATIVEAMIKTAAALHVRLIAEGVENVEQANWLRQAGCKSAQGYLFSRPLTVEATADFLGREVMQ